MELSCLATGQLRNKYVFSITRIVEKTGEQSNPTKLSERTIFFVMFPVEN